jgi:hypothetical protein
MAVFMILEQAIERFDRRMRYLKSFAVAFASIASTGVGRGRKSDVGDHRFS